MPICVPMRELKDTAKFTETVCAASEPVIVTKNGREAFVSMSIEEYDGLLMEAARSRLLQRIDLAEREIAEGKYTPIEETTARLRERYGL